MLKSQRCIHQVTHTLENTIRNKSELCTFFWNELKIVFILFEDEKVKHQFVMLDQVLL